MDSSIKNLLPDIGDHENSTFVSLSKKRKLFGFKSEKLWNSIESMKDLYEIEEKIIKGDLIT